MAKKIRFRRFSRFNLARSYAVPVILMVAVVGTYLLVSSHAASPYASVSAPNGVPDGGAGLRQDCTGAGSGSCVAFNGSGQSGTLNSVARIIYSMEGPHEGVPHGAPTSYDWQAHPIVHTPVPPAGWDAIIGWGQIYADATTTEPANIRVEIKNLELYIWSLSAQKWVRLQAYEQITGAHHPEDYMVNGVSSNGSTPADLRTESDGGISTTMVSDLDFHFYPDRRAALPDPADVGGVFTTYQARLIMDDPSGPDNISQARYLANVGTDWWKDTSIAYGGLNVNNTGLGQGRFTYLSGSWQAEDFYTGGPEANGLANTWTEAQMEANPPPLDGMGAP